MALSLCIEGGSVLPLILSQPMGKGWSQEACAWLMVIYLMAFFPRSETILLNGNRLFPSAPMR